MQEFLEIVAKMRDGSSRNFFENLYAFFHKISTLNRDEIIAMQQAFSVLRDQVLSDAERKTHTDFLGKTQEAIIARMQNICCDTPPEFRATLAETFWRITDRPSGRFGKFMFRTKVPA